MDKLFILDDVRKNVQLLLISAISCYDVSQLDLHDVGEETTVIINNIKEPKSNPAILPGPSTVVLMADLTKI